MFNNIQKFKLLIFNKIFNKNIINSNFILILFLLSNQMIINFLMSNVVILIR